MEKSLQEGFNYFYIFRVRVSILVKSHKQLHICLINLKSTVTWVKAILPMSKVQIKKTMENIFKYMKQSEFLTHAKAKGLILFPPTATPIT